MTRKETNSRASVFDQIVGRKFDSSCCFLCGAALDNLNRSEEHVFPKWILSKYNLWDQTITLLNGTHLPYRSLKIPCCIDCNGKYLSSLENRIQMAANSGLTAFRLLGQDAVFLWLGKIFYGILYKELFLAFDRKSPNSDSIISPALMEQFKAHSIFLQGIRGKHVFEHSFPASIIIVETQCPDESQFQWHFCDSMTAMMIDIRMGTIGIVAVLQDGGTQEVNRDTLAPFFNVPLHPLQFKELIALVAYRASLMNRTPNFVSVESGDKIRTTQLPIGGLSSKPVFDEWVLDDFAQVLSFYTGQPLDKIHPSPDQIMSWITDSTGQVTFIDWKENPIP
jgi:hypothetical protein